MVVFFGSYAIKAKTYSSLELGLDDIKYANFTFQFYLKFFNIILIPFFPLSKHWVILDEYGNITNNTDASLRHKLTIIELKKSYPIWTYFGCILISIPFIYLIFKAIISLFVN